MVPLSASSSRTHDNSSNSNDALHNEQGQVECVADEWASVWGEHDKIFSPPDGPLPCDLEPLTAALLRKAARTFPTGTGLGADNVAPRAHEHLPEHSLQSVANLPNRCEYEGRWPARWELVLICLILKSDGGRRPIGLFPSVVRLWMRARVADLRE